MEFSGVSFPVADSIALRLGFARDAPERLEAAIAHVVGLTVREGHTVSPRAMILAEAAQLLGPRDWNPGRWRLGLDYEVLEDSSARQKPSPIQPP